MRGRRSLRLRRATAIAAAAAVLALAAPTIAQAGPDTWWDGDDGTAASVDVVQYTLAIDHDASVFTATFRYGPDADSTQVESAPFSVRINTDYNQAANFVIAADGGWGGPVELRDAGGIPVPACPVTVSHATPDRSVQVSIACIGETSWVEIDAGFGDPDGSSFEKVPSISEWSPPVTWWDPPAGVLQAVVQRFWSPGFQNAHFYTINDLEASTVMHDPNWTYEGTAFVVAAAPDQVCPAGYPPVYRFWSPVFRSHFFTVDQAEYQHIVSSDRNWTYEGIAYCAAKAQDSDAVPLTRFWSPVYRKHFFTTNTDEITRLRYNDPAWQYEGTAYLVWL